MCYKIFHIHGCQTLVTFKVVNHRCDRRVHRASNMIDQKRAPTGTLSLGRRRQINKAVLIVCGFLLLQLIYLRCHGTYRTYANQTRLTDPSKLDRFDIGGYLNDGDSHDNKCPSLRHEGILYAEKGFHTDDDLLSISRSLHEHPMINYEGVDRDQPYAELVRRTWSRLAQSSVWLEDYGVYLTITRIMFFGKRSSGWPAISFLSGQIYNKDWNEIRGYKLNWQGRKITFPTVFDIPTEYKEGDLFFGPEDPRVVIEHNVDHPEPVIIFNMQVDINITKSRVMHIYRPFSDKLVRLHQVNKHVREYEVEKNWMAFFHRNSSVDEKTSRQPSDEIHFVHSLAPIRVLKCSISKGWCEWVYLQEFDDKVHRRPKYAHGELHGGTNFVPMELPDTDAKAYVGFPRSNIEAGCGYGHTYRPEMVVLLAYRNKFHYGYMSDPLEFGDAALGERIVNDPCGDGRIFIPNGISRWEQKTDIMTISYSVKDDSTQVLRIHGVHHLLANLFGGISANTTEPEVTDLKWSFVSNSLWACMLDKAYYHAFSRSKAVDFKPIPQPQKWRSDGSVVDDNPEAIKQDKAKKLADLLTKVVPAGEKYEGDLDPLLEEDRKDREAKWKEGEEKKRLEEEKKKQQEEEAAKLKAEEEANRLKAEEEKRKQQEEEHFRSKVEEEKKKIEEEVRKKIEDEVRKKLEEEMRQGKQETNFRRRRM